MSGYEQQQQQNFDTVFSLTWDYRFTPPPFSTAVHQYMSGVVGIFSEHNKALNAIGPLMENCSMETNVHFRSDKEWVVRQQNDTDSNFKAWYQQWEAPGGHALSFMICENFVR